MAQKMQETVKSFVGKDEVYCFMNTIKDKPAYWKIFLNDVLTMVKQHGPPTFFITLSCPNLLWNKLLLIITELRRELLPEYSINEIDFFERCRYSNLNPVVLARYFSTFYKVVYSPFGKIKYHAIRVEF